MTNYHSIGDVESGRRADFIKPWFRSLLKALTLIVCIGLLFGFIFVSFPVNKVIDDIIDNDSGLIVAKHVLKEGGSAVDAVIATQICVGTINAFSAGIGGGGLMMIRLPNGTAEFIDCREIAPKSSRPDMYKKNHTWSAIEINAQGGNITFEDFVDYRPIVREPVIGYYHGRKIIAPPEPTSGPALIFMLNLLEGYNMSQNGLNGINLQRIVETIKFGFARRTEMADPAFFENQKEHNDRVKEIMSKEFAARVRHNVSETRTYNPNYYDPIFDFGEDHGTTHMSSIDVNNMAVSFTSTVNQIWGARVLDSNTGIILNNEMNDFAVPGEPNIFGLWPSPYNFVVSDLGLSIIQPFGTQPYTNLTPGKRPLSSTVPSIVENEDGELELVLGGSGGTRILTAVLQVLTNVYDFDMDVLSAVNSPRVHQQLLPNVLEMESGFDYELINDLLNIGHVIQLHNVYDRRYSCQVQIVRKFKNGTIHAASDYRKNGLAAGY
ncbi:14039_t:CDS:10 [Cetraspora pellucida]|uniref:14039_t:CDS:1 n=1 Tax=Cetraspora pellucida TaxID=1433469 RepID=A0A9N9G3A0_9GLOM|nr:14039_t:CDS:10 [Cetraspora pellucida]